MMTGLKIAMAREMAAPDELMRAGFGSSKSTWLIRAVALSILCTVFLSRYYVLG